MTLGHWEYFFDFGVAATSTSTGAGVFLNRRLIGAGIAVSNITDVRL